MKKKIENVLLFTALQCFGYDCGVMLDVFQKSYLPSQLICYHLQVSGHCLSSVLVLGVKLICW